MASSRARTLQAPSRLRRESVVPAADNPVALDDDGTAFTAGAVCSLGDEVALAEEVGVPVRPIVDGTPPGAWSGEASGLASGPGDAMEDDGTGDDGTREGVTDALGRTVE